MSTAKVNKVFTKQVIKDAFKTASLHADPKNDFGLYCIGVGVAFRSLFKFLCEKDYLSTMEVNIFQSTIHTNVLLSAFEEAKEDLVMATKEGKDNRELSNKVLKAAKFARVEAGVKEIEVENTQKKQKEK